MKIGFHGGMCCGIKHIFELNADPDYLLEALSKKIATSNDVNYEYSSSEENFFTDAAPEETRLKRLDRYLDFLRGRRPSGIVEITLVTPGPGYWTQEKWVPIITERGFIEVTPEGGVYNSNSGNKVRVFHLYMKED